MFVRLVQRLCSACSQSSCEWNRCGLWNWGRTLLLIYSPSSGPAQCDLARLHQQLRSHYYHPPYCDLLPASAPSRQFSGPIMPQGIHKSARRSEKPSKAPAPPGTASRKAPRTIYPAYLSQAERTVIESWKESVLTKADGEARGHKQEDAVVQAYLETKARLFQSALMKERMEACRSDAGHSDAGHSDAKSDRSSKS